MIIPQSAFNYAIILLFCIGVPYFYRKDIGKFNAITWGLFLLSASRSFLPHFSRTVPLDARSLLVVGSGKTAFVLILLLPLLAMRLPKKSIATTGKIFFAWLAIDGLVIMSKVLPEGAGFLNAGNFDLTILVLAFFFVMACLHEDVARHYLCAGLRRSCNEQGLPFYGLDFKINPQLFVAIVALCCTAILPVFFISGSTCKLALYIGGLTIAFLIRRYWVVGGFLALGAAAFFNIPDLSRDAGRFDIWSTYASYIVDLTRFKIVNYKAFFFGFGAGSYHWMGLDKVISGTRYVIMHNDYLQVFFEYGLICFSFFVAMLARAVYELRKRPFLCGCAVAYCFAMLTYFPIYFVGSAFLGLILIRLSFEKWGFLR